MKDVYQILDSILNPSLGDSGSSWKFRRKNTENSGCETLSIAKSLSEKLKSFAACDQGSDAYSIVHVRDNREDRLFKRAIKTASGQLATEVKGSVEMHANKNLKLVFLYSRQRFSDCVMFGWWALKVPRSRMLTAFCS